MVANEWTVLLLQVLGKAISLIWNSNPCIFCEGIKEFSLNLMPSRVQILLFVFSNVLEHIVPLF